MTFPTSDITVGFSNISPMSPTTYEKFVQQPQPFYVIPFLTMVETKGFLTQLGNLVSDGDYAYVDNYGRLGKYQFNSSGLKSLGLVKQSVTANFELRWEFAWTGNNGPTSIDKFLNNDTLQDRTALDHAKFNSDYLSSIGAITQNDTVGQRAGMLFVAHFLTPELTLIWRRGGSLTTEQQRQISQLSAGLDLASVYRSGRYAVEVLPTIL